MYDVILGFLFGLIYCYYMYPKKNKEYPKICPTVKNFIYKGSFVIPINKKKALHVHHWIIFIMILILYYIINNDIPLLIFALSICMILQGLCYRDCFNIIRKNPYH